MSAKPQLPLFSVLTAKESRAVLRRNNVGRLCFLRNARVDVQPVHYAMGDGWLFVRSADGTKLEALAHEPYVAFEVDEIEGTFDWRSVVARGTIYVLPADGPLFERQQFNRAVRALRRVVPETLASGDPTPLRQTVYGIHLDELTGRMAQSEGKLERRRQRAQVPTRRATRPADGS